MIKKITIDKDKCIHCGMCIKDCPTKCIEFSKDKIPQYINGGKDICFGCQHCFSICPVGAISFADKNPDKSESISFGNSEDLKKLIKSRRSIRFYKNENVPKDKLDKIIEILPYSPTATNRDNLHFSIIETKEKMDEIRKLTYEKVLSSNMEIPLFEMAKEEYKKGNDLFYRGATSMIAVCVDKNNTSPGAEIIDPTIALSYIELYAQSLGLGTTWCGIAFFVLNQFPEIYKLLNIPNNYTLSYTMLLGVPNIKYARTPQPDKYSVNLIK